jgi:transposase InsO family protein
MTAIDAYTRFLIVVPLRNKSAEAVADALVEQVFLPFGTWRSLVTDCGKEFINEILDSITNLLGIRKLKTTVYRLSSNGKIERVHSFLNNLLAKTISDHQKDWQERLSAVVASYNASYHEAIGYSPYYMLYGREYCTPLGLQFDWPEDFTPPQDEHEYTAKLQGWQKPG